MPPRAGSQPARAYTFPPGRFVRPGRVHRSGRRQSAGPRPGLSPRSPSAQQTARDLVRIAQDPAPSCCPAAHSPPRPGGRPERVPRCGFVANGSACLWRTMCAATGGTGLAQGVQNAETVAANIVRHGRSSGEGRTGPAGTCAPPRFCGARVRILWRTMCAATGRRVCGARGGAGFFPHRSRFYCTLPRWSSGGAQVEFR